MISRTLFFYIGWVALIVVVGLFMGLPFTVRLCVEAMAYGLIALGLNIQWGYAGLSNFGVMGFLMVGAFSVTAMSAPLNVAFWASEGPFMLLKAIVAAGVGAIAIIAANRFKRSGVSPRLGRTAQVLAWIFAYIIYRSQLDPAVQFIEANYEWVGGLGLPIGFGWILAGILAAGVAFLIGKVCLGLRSDYLAIATIGISEILRALIKNMDWLTRGTLTVSPLPWPVPLPQDYQTWGVDPFNSFIFARSGYFVVVALLVGAALFLIQRAYRGPWGRMNRAIRDNHIAAAAIGKNVTARQIEIFVLGSILIGVGGGVLSGFAQIFDPGGYQPINHTFLIWVMVIVGGAGNNLGALFGGLFIYTIWVLAEPVSMAAFSTISDWTTHMGWGAIPEMESRALQMRVFVLGLVITIALRYAPKGLIPEVIGHHFAPKQKKA